MIRSLFALALTFVASAAIASPREWVDSNRAAILREYLDLLAIPNVASNNADIRRNADFIVAMMQRRGLAPRLLEGEDGGSAAHLWRMAGPGRDPDAHPLCPL